MFPSIATLAMIVDSDPLGPPAQQGREHGYPRSQRDGRIGTDELRIKVIYEYVLR
jgi:hypothetical protein